MSEKYKLKQKIIKKLEDEGFVSIIIDEVFDSLDYLNKYKLKNIYDNIAYFVEDLKVLNIKFIDWLKKI